MRRENQEAALIREEEWLERLTVNHSYRRSRRIISLTKKIYKSRIQFFTMLLHYFLIFVIKYYMALIVPSGIPEARNFPVTDIPAEGAAITTVMLGGVLMHDFSSAQYGAIQKSLEIVRLKINDIYEPSITKRFLGGFSVFYAIYGLTNPAGFVATSVESRFMFTGKTPSGIAELIGDSTQAFSSELPVTLGIVREVSGMHFPGDVQPCIYGAAVARRLVVDNALEKLEEGFD